jgi:hypothetical protein
MKGCYKNMWVLLKHINYDKYLGNIYSNLKVITLLEMQLSYKEYCCSFVWVGQLSKDRHYSSRTACWREFGSRSEKCVILASCKQRKSSLPLLHIKSGLMKISVKVTNKDNDILLYLKNKFLRKSEAK